jgi:hypothetical protein
MTRSIAGREINFASGPTSQKANLEEIPRGRPGLPAPPPVAADHKSWAYESAELAQRVAYVKGTLKGGTDRSDGPVLPGGYTREAKAIAERRVVLAGYRLAEVLKAATTVPIGK